ncbi:MAG: hypothetical protein ACFFE4_22005 [Candidatus Thorarchaeota archaeon]
MDKNFPIEIKTFHALKKIPDAFIMFSLVLVIVTLLIIVYNKIGPVNTKIGPLLDPYLWRIYFIRIDKLLHLMVVYGIAGVIIFSPISFVLRVKLKRLHIGYKKGESGYHRELKQIKREIVRNMDTSKIYYS